MPSYQNELNKQRTEHLRLILKELPLFCGEFFRAIENTTSVLTRLNYAYDLRIFFNYYINEVGSNRKKILDITLDDLAHLTLKQVQIYAEYLNLYYTDDDKERENKELGKKRKIASLRSFFKYFHKSGALKENVCSLLDIPKIHEKPIIRLDHEEAAAMLDLAESGDSLSKTQKRFHKVNKVRDLAILTLFLTTGIRVSELVGINMSDIDFRTNSFKVTRKGGSTVILYFGEEAKKTLLDYIEERKAGGSYTLSSPLFISLQDRRMSVRAVENLVHKYAQIVSPLKKISPHKLRSTYGTLLYQETGDIYLVADVLGHKDVNTTKKHYAAITEENRKKASKYVKLRES